MLRAFVFMLIVVSASSASAQSKNATPAKPAQPATPAPGTKQIPPVKPGIAQKTPPRSTEPSVGVRGFFTLGTFVASATDTFEAVLGSNSGLIFGGGAQVLFRKGLYAEVAASRFKREGERVFVGPDQEVFPLGIPLDVTLTPLEFTGGWRYRHCPPPLKGRPVRPCNPRVIPYVGGGWSWYRYQETSDGDDAADEVDERFSGFHILGGAEYKITPLVAIGGEVAWSSIPDALGEGGVSAAFNETNLGGTTLRVKISIGR
jgi:hypothetical protein